MVSNRSPPYALQTFPIQYPFSKRILLHCIPWNLSTSFGSHLLDENRRVNEKATLADVSSYEHFL